MISSKQEEEYEKPLVEKYRPVTLDEVVGKYLNHLISYIFYFCSYLNY